MEAALSPKSEEESKRAAASDAARERVVQPGAERGAAAGLPLFLRSSGTSTTGPGVLQRQAEEAAAEERAKPTPIRSGLTVSRPGDPNEREADRVASAVLDRGLPGGSGGPPAGPPAPRLAEGRTGGQPLPEPTRGLLEPLLGRDLSEARVHTDTRAGELSRAIQARAFTRGRDIFFAPGRYDPTSRSGLALLAHELTHVVQGQRAGAADLQAQLEQDFVGQQVVAVPTSGAWPAGYVRVRTAAGAEVMAPARPYQIDQIPPAYDRLSITRPGTTTTVGELREARRGGAEVTVMVAMYDGVLHMVGYDSYRVYPGGRARGTPEMHSGFVEAGAGTGGVGRNLVVERIRQVVRAGIPLMRLEVNEGIEPTMQFHARLKEAAGLAGLAGRHYAFGPRQMASVLGNWGDTLTANQRVELLALARGTAEPTIEAVQAILFQRIGGGPGGGSGGPPMLPGGGSGSTLGRFRSAPVRAAGVGLGLIAVANDIVAPIAATYGVQREVNRMWEAQIEFWASFGAHPRVGVWDWDRQQRVQSLTDPNMGVWDWDKEPTGADTTSRTGLGILESHRSKYVVDIDIEAFKHYLPGFIRDYQDLVLFLAMANELSLRRGRAIRKEGNRYLATVSGPAYGSQIEYDITDTIEQIRARTIRQSDARMQAELRDLPPEKIGNVYRLKSGRNASLYRSAGGQELFESELYLGPNPWVRTVGNGGFGGEHWHWAKVLVAPANGDALRGAQLATYRVGRQDIDEAFEEVQEGGRPIVSVTRAMSTPDLRRLGVSWGRLEGFVAGPDPGGRFGLTRYVRDPQNPDNRTIAVGELKQFWVDASELEPVDVVRVLNYAALPAEARP